MLRYIIVFIIISINTLAFDLYVPYDFYKIVSIQHTFEKVSKNYIKLEVSGTYETKDKEVKEFALGIIEHKLNANTEDKFKIITTDKIYFDIAF